jgi:hypothetical protein
MGFSISWIGVKGRSKQDVLAELDLIDTGTPDPGNRAKFSCAELPGSWLIVYARDCDYASPKRIEALARGGFAMGCVIEDHVMYSSLRAFEGGSESWSVIHDAQKGLYDLTVQGAVPAQLNDIRERLTREQEEDSEEPAVDFIFDIPVALGAALCGYRYDGEEGSLTPQFTVLRRPQRGLFAIFSRSRG